MEKKNYLKTSQGHIVDDNQNSLTAGQNGPVNLMDFYLIDKLAKFNRERIPERVVHAKGSGAFGYFEVTQDLTKYCKAKFLNQIGKKTPIFVRFSTVGGEKGSADTERDPRGFAVKFYTEEGNLDIVGNNTPVFFIRDPIKFPDFIHTQKRNPETNLKDADMMWDFLNQTPEAVHQLTILFSNRGTPDGYRKMNGYGSHTFRWVNELGEVFYIKYHFKTKTGIKNLRSKEASDLMSKDPDYAQRDLFNHIKNGGTCEWRFCVQIMPEKEAENYKINIFDVTKVWPHNDYPLIEVGNLVLNRNPENYFADVEQSAFSPSHLVNGIEPSNDKMLQGRLFSYPDTQRHRLGGNYHQIPVNKPINKVSNGQRDGYMVVDGNQGNKPNYEPNSFCPYQFSKKEYQFSTLPLKGFVGRFNYNHPNDDFEQAGNLYKVLNDSEKEDLIDNLAENLKNAQIIFQEKQVRLFYKCNEDYGTRLAKKLNIPIEKIK